MKTTRFNAIASSTPPVLAALVSGAGTSEADGTYTKAAPFSGHEHWEAPSGWCIERWPENGQWLILDTERSLAYFATSDEVLPWDAVLWLAGDTGSPPAPTVTEA